VGASKVIPVTVVATLHGLMVTVMVFFLAITAGLQIHVVTVLSGQAATFFELYSFLFSLTQLDSSLSL
jgi:hypothetical protein